MKYSSLLFIVFLVLIYHNINFSEPGFNGTVPGCGSGGGCHTSVSGIISAEALDNFQVRITVAGTTSKVGGELVDAGGNVVAVINSTSSNPFTLTAPSSGSYTVNAGFKNPSLQWGSSSVDVGLTGTGDDNDKFILSYKMESNYPNPFNPKTLIRYRIPESGMVSLKVYDLLGNEVASLVNEFQPLGSYEVNFDGADMGSGVYFYQLQSGNYTSTRKMLLIK